MAVFLSPGRMPLPYMIEGAPLELYRYPATRRRDLLEQGMQRFMDDPARRRFYLPVNMGRQQWKKGAGGGFRPGNASAKSYLTAIMSSPGPKTARTPSVVGRIQPPRRYDAFQQWADETMARGAWRPARSPVAQMAVSFPSAPALSRNIPGRQLLPADIEALGVYEEAAVDARRFRHAQATRAAINRLRAADNSVYGILRRGRR